MKAAERALVVTIALAALAWAGSAQAATHPFLPASSLDGSATPSGEFDKPCGAATDTEGDLYVANSGKGSIDVFDSEGTYLTRILDSHEPCGLAVGPEGDVFALDTETGDVVRWGPEGGAYPPGPGQPYEAAVTVEGSGEARGIAVNPAAPSPTKQRLYVSKGSRIDSLGREVQQVSVGATGGTFKLSFEGEETASLPYDASAAEVQSALQGLAGIGAANATVTRAGDATVGSTGSTYTILFAGELAYAEVPQVKAISALTRNETQKVTIRATAGTFKLSFEGQQTAAIPYNASAAELKAALEALSNIAPGDVSVTGGPGDESGSSPYLVTFEGAWADTDVGQMSLDSSALSGGTFSSRVTTSTPGTPRLVASTASSGGIGAGERQQVSLEPTASGTYELLFEGEETTSLEPGAPASSSQGPGSLEAALEALPAIGAGNVSVSGPPGGPYTVSFEGALAATDVPQIEANTASLTSGALSLSTSTQGWDGRLGEGTLSEAAGIGVWEASGYLYAAEESGVVYVLDPTGTKVRAEIDGTGRPGGAFAALPEAQIAVDQANGHVLVYDAEEEVADEFESTGQFVSELSHSFEDAGPSAIAVDRSQGESAGRVYVTSGAGAGAEALAFGPLPSPTHRELTNLDPQGAETAAGEFKDVCGSAVDSHGDLYLMSSGTSAIEVFSPDGAHLTRVGPPGSPTIAENKGGCPIAVDSEGNVFVSRSEATTAAERTVVEYPIASSYPYGPDGPSYGAAIVIAPALAEPPKGLAINPANDHLFVSYSYEIREYASSAEGAGLLREGVGQGLGIEFKGIAINGLNSWIYAAISNPGGVDIIDPGMSGAGERIAVINGSNAVSKKPGAGWSFGFHAQLAIDQSNGHLYVAPENSSEGEDVYEFEASGAYVSRFGRAVKSKGYPALAVDNSAGPNARTLFVAGGINGPTTVDAYGPAEYGAPPQVETGPVSGADGTTGTVTLEGTVNPSGAAPSACAFQYVSAEAFGSSEFSDLSSGGEATCEPGPAEIGNGNSKVAVKATVSGLDSTKSYRYRLVAENSYGEEAGEARSFGPPAVSAEHTQEALYTEAILAATVDPAGLPTEYRCEYGPTASYGHSTAPETIEAEAQISCPLFGLAQGTTYHYRVVASNGWGSTPGEDRTFTTLVEAGAGSCPNAALRTGPSASLPECRAYELVGPADSRGGFPYVEGFANNGIFNEWMSGPGGDSVAFFTQQTLLGAAGNGATDAYRARRTAAGWTLGVISPSAAQAAVAGQGGFSRDQEYSFWKVDGQGSLSEGSARSLLRTPDGFETLGVGEEATDPQAQSLFLAAGGSHVIFSSAAHLSAAAPPAGTTAIYDRRAGAPARLVSLLPGGGIPGGDSTYLGASEDGSAIVFEAGGATYVRLDGTHTEQIPGFGRYAGASADGSRVFYADVDFVPGSSAPAPAGLHAFDTATATATEIAPESIFVNVSADGSHAYFTSTERLDEAGEGVPGEDNLYVWDGAAIRLVAVLAPEDLEEFKSGEALNADRFHNLVRWTNAIERLADDPSRSSPDGRFLVFQSHASLTSYDAEGHYEIYRYDAANGSLLCVSCDPGGAPPLAPGATLQETGDEGRSTSPSTIVPGVTPDGGRVFFESKDALVPGDVNGVRDVYEWRAQGLGGCALPAGCLSLISSGHSPVESRIYGMTPDGSDVFFVTYEKLVGADEPGSGSIYDARVGGGFAEAATSSPCEGDACQGEASAPPALARPASEAFSGPGNAAATTRKSRRCPKGRRRVRRHGKARCVKKKAHRKRHRRHHRHRGHRAKKRAANRGRRHR